MINWDTLLEEIQLIKELKEDPLFREKLGWLKRNKSKLEQVLHEGAPGAARYLRDVIQGKVRRPSWIKFKICEYILDHEFGEPKIKGELPEDSPLTRRHRILEKLLEIARKKRQAQL